MAKTRNKKNRVNRPARKARKKARRNPPRAVQAFARARSGAHHPAPLSSLFSSAEFSPVLLLKFAIGLLLLPVCWVSIETFFVSFGHAARNGAFWRTPEFWFFTVGALAWTAVFYTWRHRLMVWLYVAGHELTHAFFVLVCRGNVAQIRISAEGGHILTNRNNFLISLSPYFFPFYTIILIALWALVEWWLVDFTAAHRQALFGLIGLTWAFHLTFTIWMIRREQPDVDQNGKLFSYATIVLANMLIISGLLVTASPSVTLLEFGRAWLANLLSFGPRLAESAIEIWTGLRALFD